MSKNKSQFLDLIKSQRDNKPDTKFEGTFLEYLEVVRENPGVVKHAHKRLNDTVERFGVSVLPDEDPRKRKIFDGDNIKKFADEQSTHGAKKILKDGVGFLFGTDSVDRMIGDLDTFVQKCLISEESKED